MRTYDCLAGAAFAALVFAGAGASAQTPAPTCTTNVTVVSRGGEVVSSTAATRCEGAPPAAASPSSQSCTQTTTVVRRLDVVVSNSTAIKCEDQVSGGGGGGTPRAVLAAPAGAVTSLGKALLGGSKDVATVSNVKGFWRVIDEHQPEICLLVLSYQPDPAGFHVRRTNCKGELAKIEAWTFDSGAVTFHAKGGAVISRLTGNRERLEGAAVAGGTIVLGR